MTLVMPLCQDPQIIGPGAKSMWSATSSVRGSADVLGGRSSSRSILKKQSTGLFVSQLPDSGIPAGDDAFVVDIDEILGPEGQEDFKADVYPLKRIAPWQIPKFDEMSQFSDEPFSLRVGHGKDHYGNLRRAQNQHFKDIKPDSPPGSRAPELYNDLNSQGGGSSPKSAATRPPLRTENRARKSMRRLREKLVESSWEAFGPQMLSMFEQ